MTHTNYLRTDMIPNEWLDVSLYLLRNPLSHRMNVSCRDILSNPLMITDNPRETHYNPADTPNLHEMTWWQGGCCKQPITVTYGGGKG